nr:acyl-CoA thioester hydrolase/BAAT C-terminal domain-containing protein [Shimazuella soli]
MLILICFTVLTNVLYVHAAPINDYAEKEIAFQSQNTTMHGTVLMPKGTEKHPGIVLVHGSGQKEREKLRQDAEVFAKAGFATLIYDKRDKSKNRTLEVLSEDALAAVHTLQSQSGVDKQKVGIWGFSEGAWVAPMAAAKSKDISFVVLLGTPVITPIQQQTYNIQNRFVQNGVISQNVMDSLVIKGSRFVFTSGMFPEADHNAEYYLKQVKQPILAVWGAKDRLTPAVEGSEKLKQIWRENGNKYGSVLFVANADHAAHQTDKTGFERYDAFAAGYEEGVTSWLDQVVKGKPPVSKVYGQTPVQDVEVYHNLIQDVKVYDSLGVEIAVLSILLIGYLVAILNSMFHRKEKKASPITGYAGWTITSGLIATLSFATYFIMIWSKGAKIIGPIMWDRPLIWMIIQMFAWLTTLLSVILALRGFSNKALRPDIFRYSLLVFLGILFSIWAYYWGMLTLL